MVPSVELTRNLKTIASRALGAQVDVDLKGGALLLSAQLGRLVVVDIKVEDALGEYEVTHRISPWTTSLQIDTCDDMAHALMDAAKRTGRVIAELEDFLKKSKA